MLVTSTTNEGGLRDIRGNLVTPDPNLSRYCLSREKALRFIAFGYEGNMMVVRYNEGDKINCRLITGEDVSGEVLGYVAKVKEGVQIVVETQDGIKYISTNDIASYIKE